MQLFNEDHACEHGIKAGFMVASALFVERVLHTVLVEMYLWLGLLRKYVVALLEAGFLAEFVVEQHRSGRDVFRVVDRWEDCAESALVFFHRVRQLPHKLVVYLKASAVRYVHQIQEAVVHDYWLARFGYRIDQLREPKVIVLGQLVFWLPH